MSPLALATCRDPQPSRVHTAAARPSRSLPARLAAALRCRARRLRDQAQAFAGRWRQRRAHARAAAELAALDARDLRDLAIGAGERGYWAERAGLSAAPPRR